MGNVWTSMEKKYENQERTLNGRETVSTMETRETRGGKERTPKAQGKKNMSKTPG